MLLTVQERLVLRQLLPTQGNALTLTVIKELGERLEFKDEEQTALKMESKNGQVNWDPKVAGEGKEIDVGEKMAVVVVGALEDLDKRKQLHANQLSLYEKFVTPKE